MKNKSVLFTMILVVGVFFIGHVFQAYACSCAPLTEQEALNISFASFVGTPTKIESSHGYTNKVTFEIEKPIKNILGNKTEITLLTPVGGPACGYHFENNTRYLVHTFGEENQKYLETGLCSGNQNLGFSNIPLLIDDSVLENYPTSVSWYPIISFLIIAGIILGVVIGFVIWRKRK